MDAEAAGLTDAAATGFLKQAAVLLGTQTAEVTGRLDRWLAVLSQDLARLQDLAEHGAAATRGAADVAPARDRVPIVLPPPRSPPAVPLEPLAWRLRLWQPSETWNGWEAGPGAELLEAGVLRPLAQAREAWITTGAVLLQSGGLHRVRVVCPADDAGAARLQVTDSSGAPLAPDIALAAGQSELHFFAPHRTRSVRLMLRTEAPVQVGAVQLDALDIESFYRARAHLAPAPVIASLVAQARRGGGADGLRDAVESLLLQCDKVRVLLLDYWQVPDFLKQPRIEYRVCRSGEELPGEGLFGWFEAADTQAIRILGTEHAVVPPDFCAVMLAALARHGYCAVAGTRGAMVVQPAEPGQPASIALADAGAGERTVHLLRFGVLALHGACLDLHAPEFCEPGLLDRPLAEAALAVAAQRAGVPMLILPQPAHWLRDETPGTDQGDLAAALLGQQRFTHQPAGRPKLGLVLVGSDGRGLEAALAAWGEILGSDLDWAIILAGPASNARQRRTRLAQEVHRLAPAPDGQPALGAALALAAELGIDLLCVASDGLRVRDTAWLSVFAQRCRRNEALGVYACPDPQGGTLRPGQPDDGIVLALIDGASLRRGDPPAATASEARAEQQPPEVAEPSPDAGDVGLILPGLTAVAGTSFRLPRRQARASAPPLRLAVNEVFDRVIVLNGDAHFARWQKLGAALAQAGIAASRARRIDPKWEEVAADYADYCARKLGRPRDSAAIQTDRALYQEAGSQAARLAYVAHRSGRRPIANVDAWADLRSWERVLTRALRDGVSALLVMRDEVMPDPRAPALFAAAAGQLPDDWLCLRLATAGVEPPPLSNRYSRLLWCTEGSPAGDFAVGLRAEALPFLLGCVRRRDLGFDAGALSTLTRVFARRCFAMAVNAILPPGAR